MGACSTVELGQSPPYLCLTTKGGGLVESSGEYLVTVASNAVLERKSDSDMPVVHRRHRTRPSILRQVPAQDDQHGTQIGRSSLRMRLRSPPGRRNVASRGVAVLGTRTGGSLRVQGCAIGLAASSRREWRCGVQVPVHHHANADLEIARS